MIVWNVRMDAGMSNKSKLLLTCQAFETFASTWIISKFCYRPKHFKAMLTRQTIQSFANILIIIDFAQGRHIHSEMPWIRIHAVQHWSTAHSWVELWLVLFKPIFLTCAFQPSFLLFVMLFSAIGPFGMSSVTWGLSTNGPELCFPWHGQEHPPDQSSLSGGHCAQLQQTLCRHWFLLQT